MASAPIALNMAGLLQENGRGWVEMEIEMGLL